MYSLRMFKPTNLSQCSTQSKKKEALMKYIEEVKPDEKIYGQTFRQGLIDTLYE